MGVDLQHKIPPSFKFSSFGKGLVIHLEQAEVVGVEGELLWTHPRPQR